MFNCDGHVPSEVESEVIGRLQHEPLSGAVVTLRFKGMLQGGKISDISYREIVRTCYSQGAMAVLKNTYDLRSAEMEAVKVETGSVEEVEAKLIQENVGQQTVFSPEAETRMIHNLMQVLATEKEEGETNATFEKRVLEEVDVLFTD